MSNVTFRRLSAADQALLAEYLHAPRPDPTDACCAAFARGVFAASIHDPQCCVRCCPARQAAIEARRYAWQWTPFGRMRKVRASEAQAWPEE